MKKLMKIAVAAFAIALLLAVSSFAAYSVALDGTVSGLEDGVEYLLFKYDFAHEVWESRDELTASTQLTPGVWGIKAGDADMETVFVSGGENGEITFWDAEKDQPAYNTSSPADTFVPGKWNVSTGGVLRAVAFYVASNKSEASACMYLVKSRYLEQVYDTTAAQKTVTVGEAEYPLYTIDGVEHYLKDEAYYAVDGDALYEGEGEAEAVYPLTWKNAKPIIGEKNLLQETVLRYGFSDSQIVPAKDVKSIPNAGLTIQTGGNALGDGYTTADIKGTFTFVVKTPGVEGYQRYVVDIDAASVGRSIAAPAEMAESEGYLVAFEFAPYVNCPDDIFKGSPKDAAGECYAHYFLKCNGDRNVIDYTAHLLPAPTGLIDGFGTIGGLDDGKSYEIASATINTDGSGLALGNWDAFDPDDRSLAGLYAVREVYGDRATDVAFAYSYGTYADRQAIGALGGANNDTVVVTGGSQFLPGQYSGHYTTYKTSTLWEIMSHGQVDASLLSGSKTAKEAYDALVASGTASEGDIADAKATLDKKNTSLVNALKKIVLRYTYAPEEIVPVGDVNSFKITAFQNNGGFTMSGNQNKRVVAFVADSTGAITTYETIISQPFATSLNFTIDFTSFLPEEGYLVAFEVYLVDNISLDNFGKVTAPYAFRYYTTVNPANYSIDEPAALPVIDDKPEGIEYDVLTGIVSGLDASKRYQYAQFNISGNRTDDWTILPLGTTTLDLTGYEGLVAIAYASDGYSFAHSLPTYVYIPGASYDNILHTKTITGDAGSNKDLEIDVPLTATADTTDGTVYFNAGKWTGIGIGVALQKTYSFAPLILGSTGCYAGSGTALKAAEDAFAALGEDASEGEIAAAQAELDKQRASAKAMSERIYFSYEYLPGEIIPMSEFVSYTYGGPRVRQSGKKLGSGNAYTKFVFKVIDENDQLVDREVLKKASYSYNESVTITASDFTETDGYIVGIVIYPFGHFDGYLTASGAGTTSGDYNIVLKADGYVVDRELPAATMTKLTETDGVVTGFDPEYTYQWAPYAIDGNQADWTDIEGDSFTLTNVGLTAIRIKTNNVTYDYSEPQIFYLAGKASERKALFELKEDDTLLYSTSGEFTPGYYTGTRISYLDQSLVAKEGAHIHLDQVVGGLSSTDEAEALWLYAHTKEEAQALLDAEADKASTYPGNVDANQYYPQRLQATIDSFYGVEGKDYEAEHRALQEMITETYKGSYIRYAYTSNEIVPVDELKSITFYNKHRQGAIYFYTKSAANFYVMDENGVVTPYQWKSGYFHSKAGSEYIQTVDVQAEVDLPDSGWIVAIEYIPFADIATDTVTGNCYTRLAYKSLAYAFEQNHVNMGFYYNNYEIEYPTIAKPELEYADGKFTGLDTAKTYAYGRFTAGGIETTEVTGVTEVTVDGVGIWGIREISTDPEYVDSPYVLGYNKDLTEARDNIIHLYDTETSKGVAIKVPVVASAGTYSATAKPVFNEGKWTGFSLSNSLAINHNYNAMVLGTTSCTIPGGGPAAAIKNAATDVALETARALAASELSKVYYSYQYTAAEAIPMNEFVSWSFTSAERQGSLTVLEGSLQTKFVFKVATENGIVDRAIYKNAALNGAGTKITVSIDDFAETDGYIVGIIIYPYGNCPEGTVIGADTDVYNNTPIAEDLTVILGNDYLVIPAVPKAAETPVITIGTTNADITVTNYNALYDYGYSCDGGETWVPFTGNSFRATKASTEYVVKVMTNGFFEESASSNAVVSPVATLVGTSLVLDGQIGLKVYVDIDTELVGSVMYYTTKVNRDYAGNADLANLYRQGDFVTFTRGNKWMTPVTLDEETGLYYTIIYVPAKDMDNISFEAEFNAYLKSAPDAKITISNIGFKFSTYIDQAKALADAGNEEFVKALPLIESLETYTAYADNYFNGGEAEAYASSASTEDVEAATRSNVTLAGAEFYGTSLILEDQVTIRHYFKVSDINAFNAAYDVADKYETKGKYVYFDIADIPAQDIGKAQTLSIKDAEGTAVYEITYSVANYIVNMMNDSDANLVSLVNAMYDYYLAAVDYNK